MIPSEFITVSQCDVDGYFVGTTLAQNNPMDPTKYLMPINSVNIPPPSDFSPEYKYKLDDKKTGWLAELIPVPVPEELPTPERKITSVTNYQLRVWLWENKYSTDEIESLLKTQEDKRLEIAWAYKSKIFIESSLAEFLQKTLKFTEGELQDMFNNAANIKD